jgi:methionyl-tRNA formyltransferase
MGTPTFAVPSLKILIENNHEILAVVTAVDKPAGRGHQIQESPIKKFAAENNLRVLQPDKLRDESFITELKNLKADLFIVVAFRMLPEMVWSLPKLGTINLHGSLLPKYRGAAPINWAIIRGEEITGVTTFFIQQEIDKGDILLKREISILEEDDAGSLHDKMMELGAETILETVNGIENKTLISSPQNDQEATTAPKIFSETCEIQWNQTAKNIHNFIRGLSPYPSAWTTFQGKKLKVLISNNIADADLENESKIYIDEPETKFKGLYFTEGKFKGRFFAITGNHEYLEFIHVQLEGKKSMPVKDFINGLKK